MQTTIRAERPEDLDAIRAVNLAAFETSAEADLVDALRQSGSPIVSLVAVQQNEVIGHILFSPVTIDGYPNLRLMGLAPMAVMPAQQRRGVGSALVRSGLVECRKLGIDAVVVLGHSSYYPRFGFQPSSRFDICSDYDVPEEVFMAIELRTGSLNGVQGIAHYHRAFKDV